MLILQNDVFRTKSAQSYNGRISIYYYYAMGAYFTLCNNNIIQSDSSRQSETVMVVLSQPQPTPQLPPQPWIIILYSVVGGELFKSSRPTW